MSFGRLGRDTAVYALGTLLSRVVAFIMLPVYTRLLVPADYGLLQMLDLTLEVTAILLSAGTTLGVMRFYFKETRVEMRRSVVSSAWLLLISLNALGSIALALAAGPIWRSVLHGAGDVSLVYIAAANFTVGALTVVPLLLMQIEQRPVAFLTASTLKLVLQLTLNIVFIAGLRWGPRGVLVSTLVTNLAVGTVLSGWMLRKVGFQMRWTWFRALQRFGWPHQLGAAAMFILAYGDRWFLGRSHGLAAVGIYGLAYQFGFLLSNLGSTSFLQAWTPQRFQIVSLSREERDARYNQGMVFLTLINVTLFVGISLFSRPLLTIMSAASFRVAADVIPVVVLCYVVQGWTAAVHFGIDVSERTVYSGYANWIAAAVTIAAYALLIPPFGGLGAAVATLIGFSVRFACVYAWASRLWPVSYRWRENVQLLALGCAVVAVGTALRFGGFVFQLAGSVLLIGVYAAVTWVGIITPSMRATITNQLRRFTIPLGLARAAES